MTTLRSIHEATLAVVEDETISADMMRVKVARLTVAGLEILPQIEAMLNRIGCDIDSYPGDAEWAEQALALLGEQVVPPAATDEKEPA